MATISVTNIGSNSGIAISSLTVTVPAGGVPAGSQIIVCVSDNANTGAAGSVADTAGNTYVGEAGQTNNGVNANGLGIIIRQRTGLALNQNDTITYTLGTGGTAAAMSAFYVKGLLNAPVDLHATNSGSSTTPSVDSSGGGSTPTTQGELFVGMVSGQMLISSFTQDSTNAAWTSPPGQISLAAPPLGGGNVINAAKTALVYAPTFGTSDNWAAIIISMAPDPAFFRWFNWLSEPVRQTRGLAANLQQFAAYTLSPNPLAPTAWFSSLSEPVKVLSKAAALAASGLTFVAPVPPPGLSFGNQWVSPSFDQQIQYQTIAKPVFTPAAEVITEDKWHEPWSEPVRVKVSLDASRQQFIAYVEAAPFAETVTEDRWHQPWSEPLRSKSGLLATTQPFLAYQPAPSPFVATGWYGWLFEPLRAKPGLAISLQQFLAFVQSAPFAESVTEDRWHQPWSEPVRIKLGLAASEQPFLAAVPLTTEVVTLDKWFEQQLEPVRFKPGLAVPFHQFLAFVQAAPFAELVTESRWHQPWSEPVRQKLGLQASAQQFLAFHPLPIVTAPFLSTAWYEWLAEPIRVKLGLATNLQQWLAHPPRLLPTPSITGTLAAIETGDTALFGGITFNVPNLAQVGLNELSFTGAMVGLIEGPRQSAIVAVGEQPVALTGGGMPVAVVASAAVSIREI